MTETLAPPGGGGNKPPLGDPYVTVGGDSLPGVAELYGHPGEWQAIAQANPELPDPHYLYPGFSLKMPEGWVASAQAAPAESSSSSHAHARTRESDER